jgi:metal-responsive CopG/Arc/MetJ family transcriptional regulator
LNPSGYKVTVSLNLPIKLLEKVDEMTLKRRKNRSHIIKQLLEVGLFVEEKVGLVETWSSQDIEDIKEQIESGELVDWVAKLDLQKFTTLMHIFTDETKARGLQQKLG